MGGQQPQNAQYPSQAAQYNYQNQPMPPQQHRPFFHTQHQPQQQAMQSNHQPFAQPSPSANWQGPSLPHQANQASGMWPSIRHQQPPNMHQQSLAMPNQEPFFNRPHQEPQAAHRPPSNVHAIVSSCPPSGHSDDVPEPGSFVEHVGKALLSNESEGMHIQEIYKWFLDNFKGLDPHDKKWKGSIRNHLTEEPCFIKVSMKVQGKKGGKWALHPLIVENFKEGDFRVPKESDLPLTRGQKDIEPLLHKDQVELQVYATRCEIPSYCELQKLGFNANTNNTQTKEDYLARCTREYEFILSAMAAGKI